jgi:glycerol-3-phosphate acyltransferase PlsX
MITLAVDCMGGDHGPRVTLAACRQFLNLHPDVHLLLVGKADELAGFKHERVTVVPATEVVSMDDPGNRLRKKKDSSMRVAVQQVKNGAAQAAVSAGNTGALMAISRYLLKTLDGIDRPAIAFGCPTPRVATPPCWTWGPTWTARGASASVCGHGLGPGVGAQEHGGAQRRPAQHR